MGVHASAVARLCTIVLLPSSKSTGQSRPFENMEILCRIGVFEN